MHWLAALLLGVAVTEIAIFVTTIYLHRGLAHGALKFHPFLTLVFRSIIWITTGMKPREWAAIHQQHHAKTDTTLDPHSPKVHGFWRVQLGNVGLYRKASKWPEVTRREELIQPKDALDAVFYDHALWGLAVGITLLVFVTTALGLGWVTGLVAAVIHTVTYIMLSGAINAVGHYIGTRPDRATSATNVPGLSLLTAGEGLHNNHHAASGSPRFARRWWQIDPAWPVIKGLEAVRLLTITRKLQPIG